MKISNTLSVNNKTFDLNYEAEENPSGIFKICISKSLNGNVVDKANVLIEQITKENIDSLTKMLCSAAVTPTSLMDIIRDELYDKIRFE